MRVGVVAHERRRVAAQRGVQVPSERVRHLDPSVKQLWSQEDSIMLIPKTGQMQLFFFFKAFTSLSLLKRWLSLKRSCERPLLELMSKTKVHCQIGFHRQRICLGILMDNNKYSEDEDKIQYNNRSSLIQLLLNHNIRSPEPGSTSNCIHSYYFFYPPSIYMHHSWEIIKNVRNVAKESLKKWIPWTVPLPPSKPKLVGSTLDQVLRNPIRCS